MAKIKIFLDADVIISSLLSQKGASFEIIDNQRFKKIISKTIKEEVTRFSERQSLDQSKVLNLLKKLQKTSLNISKEKLIKNYSSFVIDIEDSHVVYGSYISKSRFLLTHNKRHFKLAKIKNDLEIIVMTPGEFLQYLRSQESPKSN